MKPTLLSGGATGSDTTFEKVSKNNILIYISNNIIRYKYLGQLT